MLIGLIKLFYLLENYIFKFIQENVSSFQISLGNSEEKYDLTNFVYFYWFFYLISFFLLSKIFF